MEAYNQNLLQDAFFHIDNLKKNLTILKLNYNRNRELVSAIDEILKDCNLIQLIIRSYDNYNFRNFCDIVNCSFKNSDCHGVIIIISKKRYGNNYDRTKMHLLTKIL